MPSKEGKLWRGVVWMDGKRVSQVMGGDYEKMLGDNENADKADNR